MRDIHLHLSGATPPEVLWEIIRESGLKTGAKDFWEFYHMVTADRAKIKDLDTYIRLLRFAEEAQSSPAAMEKSVYHAYRSSYMAGCTYMELRWNCIKRSQRGRIDLDSLIVAARAGYERARRVYGIEGGMILCLGRDSTPQENEATLKKALQYHGKGIIGIDIAGPEKNIMSEEFIPYFKAAHTAGMVTTCHVGETKHDGVEDEIAWVLEKLRPRRIGHGIQIVDYPRLMKKASHAEVTFEICITSNVMTKAVAGIMEFPIIFGHFAQYDIDWELCTDAIYPLNTTIQKEHDLYTKICLMRI